MKDEPMQEDVNKVFSAFSAFSALEDRLTQCASLGIRPGLGRTSRLLSCLGDPQKRFRAIQILGTNGKGSTGATMQAILTHAGLRVAFYTSPHLISMQERLTVDGKPLSIESWIAACDRVTEAVRRDDVLRADPPTFFELLTAVAFAMIAESGVDVALIEAGMGGRYDSTTTCEPIATVVTPIGMDHMAYLGDTLEAIASEKFAAVRPGVPAFYAWDDRALAKQFVAHCEAVGAPYYLLDEMAYAECAEVTLDGTFFDYLDCADYLECKTDCCADAEVLPEKANARHVLHALHTPLIGYHQAMNAARAITTLFVLKRREAFLSRLNDNDVVEGLSGTIWPGRLERFDPGDGGPQVLLDGAHNEHGMKALLPTLLNLKNLKKQGESAHARIGAVVFAVMKDKDVAPLLADLKKLSCPIFCTELPMERALSAPALAALAEEAEMTLGGVYPDPADALAAARLAAASDEIVLACGSLFLVGYLRERLLA